MMMTGYENEAPKAINFGVFEAASLVLRGK